MVVSYPLKHTDKLQRHIGSHVVVKHTHIDTHTHTHTQNLVLLIKKSKLS